MKTFELADAIVRKLHGQATEADILLINQWLRADKGNEILYQKMLSDGDKVLELLQGVDSGSALLRLKRRAIKEKRQRWTRVAVAASILALVSLFIFDRRNESSVNPLANSRQSNGEILPATAKATLLMADGGAILLDGKIDTTFSYGTMKMSQRDGTLAYYATAADTSSKMQELVTPKAGMYHIRLEDGSLVWLNAASRLKFPRRFATDQREVELIGEAYFEVSKDASRPFRVITNGGSSIQVLGTVFNVKGYGKDEITTTLLEGSVSVTLGQSTQLLKVGQAAKVAGMNLTIGKGDIPAATAWRQDRFMFHQMRIGEVMAEISRWYDVELDYDASYHYQQELYTGEIGREVTLDKLLAMLQETGVAKFKLKERTIHISPY